MIISKIYLTLALILYLLVAIWFSTKGVFPKKEEIESKAPKVEIVSENTFKDEVIGQVKSLTQFGQQPVTVDKNLLGKDNPFAP